MAPNGTSLPFRPAANPSPSPKPGQGEHDLPSRADEAEDLLTTIKDLIIPFIRAADADAAPTASGHALAQPGSGPRTALVEHHPPPKLRQLLQLPLPEVGQGKEGLLAAVQEVLKYSVNTWHQGFLDKLYAATTPVGLAADLVLSALNTNLHVYQVSPALTVVEKRTAKALAALFGFKGQFAGGISQPGGSAANLSSIVIARNVLFPETKTKGLGGRRFVLFTSAHGHYSLEKAAQICGFGSDAVRSVGVDERGCMRPEALEEGIKAAREAGETPFYVNATAGTTVLGSYDPLEDIARVCRREQLWLHVDGSWGAPVIFSEAQRWKMQGSELADSIALCPHKMMGIPLTCTFLLGKDMRQFHQGMTLPAGYLFHAPSDNDDDDDEGAQDPTAIDHPAAATHPNNLEHDPKEVWDLADLTPQCGRRGDSLKLALTWTYLGTRGIGAYIDQGFTAAAHLASLLAANEKFTLVSENPPPCLQVCFYFRKQTAEKGGRERNSYITEEVTRRLVPRGFMSDFAPGEEGKFFRVVVNGQTTKGTVEGYVRAIEEVGEKLEV